MEPLVRQARQEQMVLTEQPEPQVQLVLHQQFQVQPEQTE
jgi:hypothetical protein